MNSIISTVWYLPFSARSMASALADPFTKLSFVCVNLRNLREIMPFTHTKKKHISREQQETTGE
ncbi:hypothetical protein [Prevotella sp.]|uniref:hypothetical protein n=1 Tax=Prevotella sp. TaxID=59823 RepID=UPI0026494BD8|nr:hypothetical protein [Prevotella sp.]MDN5554162.1 hypothetical protein [Prevotella sp.]